jgi:hypothetical protein
LIDRVQRTGWVSSSRRASVSNPMRVGYTGHKGNQGRLDGILQQNGRIESISRRSLARRRIPPRPMPAIGIELMISSTCGLWANTGATQGLASMLIWAPGKFRRMARTAGVVMTASPIQLVDRINNPF